jgi:chemotaxis family two-component system response regulator Rcp1
MQRAGAHLPVSREILIVEDNPGDVRLIKEALKALEPPVKAHVASDGEQAMLFLRRQGRFASAPKPSLIFLDFNLPRSGSCDLLREIKKDISLTCIPVAVLTTSDVDADIRQAYELHANCYIRKPADLDGFFSTIRETAHFWLDLTLRPSEIDQAG